MTAHEHADLPDIEILGAAPDTNPTGPETGFSGYDEVFLSFDGEPAAVFVETDDDRQATPYSFRNNSKDSILDVSGGRSARFIALEGAITNNRAWLRFSVDGAPAVIELGRISRVRGGHVAVLDRSWTVSNGAGWNLRAVPHGGALSLEVISDHEITDLSFEIGDVAILAGVSIPGRNPRTRRISWVSVRGDLISTRGHPEQNTPAITASDGGELCITATRADHPAQRWCTRRRRLNRASVEIDPAVIPPISG